MEASLFAEVISDHFPCKAFGAFGDDGLGALHTPPVPPSAYPVGCRDTTEPERAGSEGFRPPLAFLPQCCTGVRQSPPAAETSGFPNL